LYSGGIQFDSRQQRWLSCISFVPQPLQENVGTVLPLRHVHFLPNPFQFIKRPVIRRNILSVLTASLNYQLGKKFWGELIAYFP
jgi:hypothetical protein